MLDEDFAFQSVSISVIYTIISRLLGLIVTLLLIPLKLAPFELSLSYHLLSAGFLRTRFLETAEV